jgi:hypothetical protein
MRSSAMIPGPRQPFQRVTAVPGIRAEVTISGNRAGTSARRPPPPVAWWVELGAEVFWLELADDAIHHTVANGRKRGERSGHILEERRAIGGCERLCGCHDSRKLCIGQGDRTRHLPLEQ